MNKNKKLKVIYIVLIVIINLILVQESYAKYIIKLETKLCKINQGDKIEPKILANGEKIIDVYNENVYIEYEDDILVDKALYWYSTDENYSKEGITFQSGYEFEEDGYYYIEVYDISGNKSYEKFCIDKTQPIVDVVYYKENEEVPNSEIQSTQEKNLSKIEKTEYIQTESSEMLKEMYEINNTRSINEIVNNSIRMEIPLVPASTKTAINVAVSDFSTFKFYAEIDSINSYNIYLTNNIDITQYIYIIGEKNIYGQGFTISNVISEFNGMMIYIGKNANVRLYNTILDGKNAGSFDKNNISVLGILEVYDSNFCNGTQGIHVNNGGILYFYSGNIYNNSRFGIGSEGTVVILGGNIYNNIEQGLHNNGGNLIVNGSSNIYNSALGVTNFNNGICWIQKGNIYQNTIYGVYNIGSHLYFEGGEISRNVVGIRNDGVFIMSEGRIEKNEHSEYSAIYQNGECIITGGSIAEDQIVFLVQDTGCIVTDNNFLTLKIRLNTYTRGRVIVRTASDECANRENDNVTLYGNNVNWKTRVIGSNICLWDVGKITVKNINNDNEIIESYTIQGYVGDLYNVIEKEYNGFLLMEKGKNSSGIISETEAIVVNKYRSLRNLALVSFKDNLSSKDKLNARFWYNAKEENFAGEGSEFESGTSFVEYGYYMVGVTDIAGNKIEKVFKLDKESKK